MEITCAHVNIPFTDFKLKKSYNPYYKFHIEYCGCQVSKLLMEIRELCRRKIKELRNNVND